MSLCWIKVLLLFFFNLIDPTPLYAHSAVLRFYCWTLPFRCLLWCPLIGLFDLIPVISFKKKQTAAAHFAKCLYYLCFLRCRVCCEIWRQGLSEIPLSNRRGQRKLPPVSSTQDVCRTGHSDVHQCLWLGEIRGTTFVFNFFFCLAQKAYSERIAVGINLKFKENPAIQITIERSQETSLHPTTNAMSKCVQ